MKITRAFSILRPRIYITAAKRLIRWIVGTERLVTPRAWGHLALRLGGVLLVAFVGLRVFDEVTWALRDEIYAAGQFVEWLVGMALIVGVVIVVLAILAAAGEGTDAATSAATKTKPAVSPPDEPAPKPSLAAFHQNVDTPFSLPAAAMSPAARQARAAQQQAQQPQQKGRR